MDETLVVDGRFCGIVGRGQGGYLAGLLAGRQVEPVQIDFRNAIPLDVGLGVERSDRVTRVLHGETVIVERRRGVSPGRTPEPVDLRAARTARDRGEAEMPAVVGSCFSCGVRPDTLRIHAGPVGDGRFATPYTPPPWVASNGNVDPPFIWAPLDCASGWCVTWDPPQPVAVTGTLTVETFGGVHPGEEYVIVAEAEPGWRTRRRTAWAALFTGAGDLVARAESLWVALHRPAAE